MKDSTLHAPLYPVVLDGYSIRSGYQLDPGQVFGLPSSGELRHPCRSQQISPPSPIVRNTVDPTVSRGRKGAPKAFACGSTPEAGGESGESVVDIAVAAIADGGAAEVDDADGSRGGHSTALARHGHRSVHGNSSVREGKPEAVVREPPNGLLRGGEESAALQLPDLHGRGLRDRCLEVAQNHDVPRIPARVGVVVGAVHGTYATHDSDESKLLRVRMPPRS